ncbi:uncharacterized protein LOC120267262 [Dioscorea cayenensis subsp. rotundata]|uniref:Uncharacterized protein LOC120267262 n=1 Tax=Dioscorea cayennensis subsp. rotundata TaxID=55577 RepID=A0AB40BWC5_DIOCR|nr:uncharacterized protein LOC120267262 [Dioscorea cayenensis subsp. rotundata]
MEKKKEQEIKVVENPARESEPTPIVEKRILPPLKEYVPNLPYPSRFKNDHMNEHFKKFLDLLEPLHINVPFAEALSQIPKRLGLFDLQPTRMTLQLANDSIRHPRGIIEDVMVKVDKFIFLVDFVILDVDEDVKVSLILGRPFLATSQALIDVSNGKMMLRAGDEEVMFALSDAMKHPSSFGDTCYLLNITYPLLDECLQETLHKVPFEESLDDPQIEETTSVLTPTIIEEITR